MYRYTTPTITCSLKGINAENLELVRIALRGNNVTIIKEFTEVINGAVTVTLTQQETASLGQSSDTIDIQGRIRYKDGTVQATNIAKATIRDVLDKVVI